MAADRVSKKLYIDRLKGIAILGVLCIHSLVYWGEIANPINKIIGMGIYGPYLFLMIGGIGAMASYDKAERSYIKFIGKRWIRLAPMYIFMILFWIVFNYTLSIMNYSVIGFNQNKEIKSLILNALMLHGVFFDSINNVVPGGWYIGVLFLLYLLFPILRLIVDKTNQLFNNQLLGGFIIVYLIYLLGLEILNSKGYSLIPNFLDFKPIIRGLPSFMMGMYLYSDKEGILRLPDSKGERVLLIAGILFVMFLSGIDMYNTGISYDSNYTFIVFHVCLYSLFRIFEKRNVSLKFLEYMGRNSYYIYLLHVLPFWYGGAILCNLMNYMDINIAYFLYFVLATVITIGLSTIMNIFDNKLLKILRKNY